jgi:alkylation response protein AidB-like acyl-CoA dehydrogenase
MPVIDLEFDLTETERAVRDTAHRFAAEVMRPAGIALDKLSADEVIADGSILWDVHKKYSALGLREIDPDLSPIEQARISYLVGEELGWGDSGLAISFGAGAMCGGLAAGSMNPELAARFPQGTNGCWAITEPNHGSDMIDFDGKMVAAGATRGRSDCIARADGNEYVISGQKAAWVSNGTVAEQAALYCAMETADGQKGGGVILVNLKTSGVSRGKALEKIGQRALNQGEIFFDEVRVPADNVICGPDLYSEMVNQTLTGANTGMSITFTGLARAAFEAALEYAQTRVQGGVPIIQHQSVKTRIFQMYRKVEAARCLARKVAMNNASGNGNLGPAIAAKVTATQTAFEVASDAMQVFGGNGISKEYPIEKMLRDARISMIEDGCNEVLGLACADKLVEE